MPNPGECNLTESRQTARSPHGKTIIHTKVGRTTRTWAILEMGMGGPRTSSCLASNRLAEVTICLSLDAQKGTETREGCRMP